nr:PKD domain-containing protein [uncultured Allomuricauda sp.]
MKLLLNRAKIIFLMVLAISYLGCEEDDEGNALPEVLAGFTQLIDENTGTVSFINTSENSDSYEWDFGDGTSSTEIDPIKMYATGTYSVSLTASNDAGASDTFEDELVIVVPEAVMLPITFDGANVDYSPNAFGGTSFEVVDNPAPGGSNDATSNVGAITNSGAEFEGIFFDLGEDIDLTTNKTIQMNFWADAPVDVLVKLEEGTGADTELVASHGGTGWELISFDFTSSDSFPRLTMFVDGPGTTAGTFYMDDVEQVETMTGGGDAPTEAAPAPPTRDAGDVISLFSNAYTDITVDTFYAGFSAGGGVSDMQVAGDDVKVYSDLDFAGIETIATSVDLSEMTNFHIDVWTATEFDLITGVVDFAGDGFGSGNDTRGDERTTLTAGSWTSVDVSIADLQTAGLTATPTDFSQLILDVVDVVGTIYVDNIYFYKEAVGGGDTPTEAAPTPPVRDAGDVISLFSNAYTDITVDTFYAGFSAGGGLTDVQVAGDDTKLYTDLDFAGIETIATSVDLSEMTNFHIDVWTATEFDLITGVVDFAGDGFGSGNDTRGDERTTLAAGSWTSVDVSITDLQSAGLTATPTDFSQLILDVVDVVGTIYVDNIYFYKEAVGGGDTPTEAAPTPPVRDAGDVISLFSNAYTDITVDTFYAGFSAGDGLTDVQVAGDDTKLYTDLDFTGIETIATSVDLSTMTNFHIDVWTATGFDFITGVVDFAGDGFGSGNDTRGDERTTLAAGSWTSVDVSIADLQSAGLTATPTDFSQLILDVVDVIGTVYVDNIYFYNDGSGGGGDTPTVAAPTPPVRDAGDVISLFSNAYTDITVDTFYAGFSAGGGLTDVQVAGDDTKLYTDLDFAGIETIATSVDLSSMTNFHIDVWTATGFDFITGVVDFAGDGFGSGNDTRGDERTTLAAGSWTSVDVSIADLQSAGLTATPTDFSQLILDVVDVIGTVYVDNIYFYNDGSGGGGDTPTVAAPTPPVRDAGDVISLFSNAYTDITVDTFYAGFSAGGGQTDVQVAGDDVKLYTDLDFAGIETIATSVDLSTMTNFHIDVWTATGFDFITGVVDFAGDGFGSGNDTRGDERTTLAAGSWTSVDVSIADLQSAGLTATPTDFSQLILDVVDVIGTVYVDNIYFYNDGSGGGGGGSCPAPPMGELLSNGGFEANSGDAACWQLNAGGGAVTVIDTDANTGTYSARLVTGPAQVPNLKQERFAMSIAGNQGVQVTFRYKINTPFVDGAILQVLAFSEFTTNPAVAHDLGNATDVSTTGVWQTYTGTFTTDASIEEGISLLIQATCGGAGTCAGEVLIDDVVVTEI